MIKHAEKIGICKKKGCLFETALWLIVRANNYLPLHHNIIVLRISSR